MSACLVPPSITNSMSSGSRDGGAASEQADVMSVALTARMATRHLPAAGGLRSDALAAELARALRERDAAQAERDIARAERDSARAERDGMTAKHAAAVEQIATLQVLATALQVCKAEVGGSCWARC